MAAQGPALLNALLHLSKVYDLWRTFRVKSKVSHPGRSLYPQKHFLSYIKIKRGGYKLEKHKHSDVVRVIYPRLEQ